MRSFGSIFSGNKGGGPKGPPRGISHTSTDSQELDKLPFKLSPEDTLTPRNALDGVAVIGSLGSGKTSGLSSQILRNYRTIGFGGLYPCCKPEDWIAFESYARVAGQSDSVIVVAHDDAAQGKEGQQ